MPAARDVVPNKWSSITVLFDDGTYSVIAGIYEVERRHLGERWNGAEESPGFPNQAGHSIFHVVPDFLAVHVLNGVREELERRPNIGDQRALLASAKDELERWR